MSQALTTHLPSITDSPQAAIDARRRALALEELTRHSGFEALLELIELREKALVDQLCRVRATNVAAEYAEKAGEIAGVRSLPGLIQGAIEEGARAEQRLRELEKD